jgi:hypothetical protein
MCHYSINFLTLGGCFWDGYALYWSRRECADSHKYFCESAFWEQVRVISVACFYIPQKSGYLPGYGWLNQLGAFHFN